MSGGKGPDWHSVLYNWLIPNRNAYDGISSDSVWVQGVSVKGAKGLECGPVSSVGVMEGSSLTSLIGCA